MTVPLLHLPPGRPAVIREVRPLHTDDEVAARLRDLGFVPGETVQVVARAPFGRDPIAVQVGFTRFALRRTEAERVFIEAEAA